MRLETSMLLYSKGGCSCRNFLVIPGRLHLWRVLRWDELASTLAFSLSGASAQRQLHLHISAPGKKTENWQLWLLRTLQPSAAPPFTEHQKTPNLCGWDEWHPWSSNDLRPTWGHGSCTWRASKPRTEPRFCSSRSTAIYVTLWS